MTALLTNVEAGNLHVGVNVIVREGDYGGLMMNAIQEPFYVAPQDWVALTGPCPTCDDYGYVITVHHDPFGDPPEREADPCPDCRDGRRIVPLYTECPQLDVHFAGDVDGWDECFYGCDDQHRLLVGRGSIEVVPVYEMTDVRSYPCITVNPRAHEPDALFERSADDHGQFDALPIDPLPVPGRDFGIVIDCVEILPAR